MTGRPPQPSLDTSVCSPGYLLLPQPLLLSPLCPLLRVYPLQYLHGCHLDLVVAPTTFYRRSYSPWRPISLNLSRRYAKGTQEPLNVFFEHKNSLNKFFSHIKLYYSTIYDIYNPYYPKNRIYYQNEKFCIIYKLTKLIECLLSDFG